MGDENVCKSGPLVCPCVHKISRPNFVPRAFEMALRTASELILCFTICVHSATRHNIHMYPYFLFAAIHHLYRPRLYMSDLVA